MLWYNRVPFSFCSFYCFCRFFYWANVLVCVPRYTASGKSDSQQGLPFLHFLRGQMYKSREREGEVFSPPLPLLHVYCLLCLLFFRLPSLSSPSLPPPLLISAWVKREPGRKTREKESESKGEKKKTLFTSPFSFGRRRKKEEQGEGREGKEGREKVALSSFPF